MANLAIPANYASGECSLLEAGVLSLDMHAINLLSPGMMVTLFIGTLVCIVLYKSIFKTKK